MFRIIYGQLHTAFWVLASAVLGVAPEVFKALEAIGPHSI